MYKYVRPKSQKIDKLGLTMERHCLSMTMNPGDPGLAQILHLWPQFDLCVRTYRMRIWKYKESVQFDRLKQIHTEAGKKTVVFYRETYEIQNNL